MSLTLRRDLRHKPPVPYEYPWIAGISKATVDFYQHRAVTTYALQEFKRGEAMDLSMDAGYCLDQPEEPPITFMLMSAVSIHAYRSVWNEHIAAKGLSQRTD